MLPLFERISSKIMQVHDNLRLDLITYPKKYEI